MDTPPFALPRTWLLSAVVASATLGLVAVGQPVRAQAAAEATAGPELSPVSGYDVVTVLERAMHATDDLSYTADMVIVALAEDGPQVTDLTVHRSRDGHLQVGRSEAWLLDVDGASTVFHDGAGDPLQFGQVNALPFAMYSAIQAYDVTIDGAADLDTGPSLAVAFRRDGRLRERLYVDAATDLVVRRETYGMDGTPDRVVALTAIDASRADEADLGAPMALATEPSVRAPTAARRHVDRDEIDAAAGDAYEVPMTLPDGFDLRAGFVIEEFDALQLVFSDGLYTLSVYDQPGRVDTSSLHGAVVQHVDGMVIHRWPGAEPERMVWSGAGHTFTAVSDAPSDVVLHAVSVLPHESPPSIGQRLMRGFGRIGDTLWPF